MRNLFIICIGCLLGLATISCDDSTEYLGPTMMPDVVQTFDTTFIAHSRTYKAGTLLSRSVTTWLGKMTDTETNSTVKAEFLSQYNCNEEFSFPDSIRGDSIQSIDLRLYVGNFVGDSLATFKLCVYPLNEVIDPDANLYTNIDLTKYYDATQPPIAEKWFTLTDYSISDEERYSVKYERHITIPLPKKMGDDIYDAFKTNPEYFENSERFINSGLPGSKGFCYRIESGEGAIASIPVSTLNIVVKTNKTDGDSLVAIQFASTEEVMQATHFDTDNKSIETLANDPAATYLKSPAGLFTEITLPVEEMANSSHRNDTINTVTLTLSRYNDELYSPYPWGVPKNVLLVRVSEYNKNYFEKNNIPDSKTSYYTSFLSDTNRYYFSNISTLMAKLIKEYRESGGHPVDPDWNKVYIIPITTTFDSNNNLVQVSHDFSLCSSKLVGGKNDDISMRVIYSRFR